MKLKCASLVAVLTKAGWQDIGGGNSFLSFFHPKSKRSIYVFEGHAGSGPNDSHWVEIDTKNDDNILAGGFSDESLVARIKS